MACTAAKYADREFWDGHFAKGVYGETYEWVADLSALAPVLEPLLAEAPGGAPGCRVLHLGCGNSELPEQLYDELGVRRCTSVDFSEAAVTLMRQRNAALRPELTWEVCDCSDMRDLLADAAFDLVVEKGLLDAVACTPELAGRRTALLAVLGEIARVLADGGAFVLATVDPAARERELCAAVGPGGAPPGLQLERSAALPPPPGASALLWPTGAAALVLRRAPRGGRAPPAASSHPAVGRPCPVQEPAASPRLAVGAPLCQGQEPAASSADRWAVPSLGASEHYGSGVGYWDQRYAKDQLPFEWLRHHEHLVELIEEATGGRRDWRILEAGCGNSELGEKMSDTGYTDITSIDSSPVAIESMAAKNKSRPRMRWLVMDATSMDFGQCCFDCVIDKSLTDTLSCLPLKERKQALRAYVAEVARVLSPAGVFLCISLANPAERLCYLQVPAFDEVEVRTLPPTRANGSEAFAYICRKRGPPSSTGPTLLDEMD